MTSFKRSSHNLNLFYLGVNNVEEVLNVMLTLPVQSKV